jgi:hemoglobin
MSIYESIGGSESVSAAVEQFYGRVLADPELKGYFEDTDVRRLKAHQRAFIAAAIGGSEIYSGRSMGDAHAGMRITDAHFDRVVGHLADTLSALGVPDATIGDIAAKLGPLRAEIVQAPAA